MLLFLATIAVSWFLILMGGHDPMDSLFEVVSSTGTVGLSAGVTSAELSPLLRGVLCADMLMGRLEILAWIVLLHHRTWLGRRRAPTAEPARIICYYRDGRFHHAEEGDRISSGDEVVVLTEASELPALQERWEPRRAEE